MPQTSRVGTNEGLGGRGGRSNCTEGMKPQASLWGRGGQEQLRNCLNGNRKAHCWGPGGACRQELKGQESCPELQTPPQPRVKHCPHSHPQGNKRCLGERRVRRAWTQGQEARLKMGTGQGPRERAFSERRPSAGGLPDPTLGSEH